MSVSVLQPPVHACESCGRHRPLFTVDVDRELFDVCGDCLPPTCHTSPAPDTYGVSEGGGRDQDLRAGADP